MEAYREYWDNHVRNVGAVKAVTHWDEYHYLSFYREVLADLKERRVKVVADVGCGPALIYKLLVEMWGEIDYCGYDVSKEMIYAAMTNAPNASFEFLSRGLYIYPRPDLILCHSVFTHISVDDAKQYLKEFRQSLTANGVISASIHTNAESGAKGSIERMDYDPAYFEELVKDAGLRVLSFVDVAVPAGMARYYRLVL